MCACYVWLLHLVHTCFLLNRYAWTGRMVRLTSVYLFFIAKV